MFILTEKPSVAKDISNALGGFTFQGKNSFDGFYQRSNDCIVWAAGHLLELLKPEDYNPAFKNWRKEDLPIIPSKMEYQPIQANLKRLSVIKDCFKKFGQDDFILATDPEREGELIGHLILQYCNFTRYDTAKRFWVAEALTPEVVKKGLENARPLLEYQSYKDAGLARSHADWIVGLNITRLLTVCGGGNLFSFGRVQTAVLGAIYLRDKAISNFKPEPYNEVEILLDDFSLFLSKNGDTKFNPNDSMLQVAKQLYQNDVVKITEVNTQLKKENPPQLFNITGLQKYCSSKYKLSPKKTLEIAQVLYEEFKVLSYPRTPSVVLGDNNIDLYKQKYELLKNHYSSFSQDCDEKNISVENKRIFNSAKLQDHHALIPLNILPDTATDDQKKVFEAVLQRFFTVIKKEHIYNSINIKGIVKGLEFIGNGKQIIQNGFRKNQTNDDVENESEKIILFPQVKEGEEYKINSINFLDKQTKPKSHFTSSSILALMENPKNEEGNKICGIGTPATRADIIQTLLNREFVEQKKQNLLITKKGEWLINTVLKNPVLKDFIGIATTTKWEEKLENSPNDFLEDIKIFTKNAVASQPIIAVFEDDKIGKCPSCNKGDIKENSKFYYCSEYKSGCKFSIGKTINNSKISINDIQILISGKKTNLKKMTNKDGKSFSAKLFYKNNKINFEFIK